MIKKELDSDKEVKSLITSHSLGPSSTWAYVNTFMSIQEGVTTTSRDGFIIKAKSLKLRLVVANADNTNLVRLILFRNDRNSTPAGMPSSTNGFCDDLFYQYNTVVYDKRISLQEPFSGGVDQKLVEVTIPLNHLVKYTGGTAAPPGQGCYWLGHLSDSGAVSHPQVYGDIEFQYVEH